MSDDFLDEKREPTAEEKRQEAARKHLALCYRKLFTFLPAPPTAKDARLVYKDLLKRCHVAPPVLTFRADNPKWQDFMEGEKNIGIYIFETCEKEAAEAMKSLQDQEREI